MHMSETIADTNDIDNITNQVLSPRDNKKAMKIESLIIEDHSFRVSLNLCPYFLPHFLRTRELQSTLEGKEVRRLNSLFKKTGCAS